MNIKDELLQITRFQLHQHIDKRVASVEETIAPT